MRLVPISTLLLSVMAAIPLAPQAAHAMPQALPEVIERLKAEGRFDHFIQQTLSRLDEEWTAAAFSADDTPDSIHSLVLLVEFSDITADQEAHSPSHFERLLFSEGEVVTGSAREFYTENSYGRFEFTGDVSAVWYSMPHPTAGYYCNADGIPGTADDYGFCCGNEMSVKGLLIDLIEASDPDIDFSRYDNDGDGYVESLFVVHAGPGAESTGDPNHIWSHRSWVTIQTDDGVTVRDYTIEPETGTIGVFVHEFGHVLGLPDLYDVDYSSNGNGDWTVMASGSWLPNNTGTRPCQFDAWSKVRLGWVDPVVVTPRDLAANPFQILRVEDSPVVYKLWTSGSPGNEYFLVENRQPVLFDTHIPGDGLLIWHIDDAYGGNANEGRDPLNVSPHYRVTLEEADCVEHAWIYWDSDQVPGSFGLETSASNGDPGDPFPGRTGNRAFHGSTWPNSHAYGETDSRVAVLDVSDSGDTMTAVFDVARSIPVLQVARIQVDDGAGGDGDGRAEPEESVRLVVTLGNVWGDAPSVTGTLSTDDPTVTILDAEGTFGDIEGGTEGDNAADPFQFSVDGTAEVHRVAFELALTARPLGREYTTTLPVEVIIGWPQVLVIDDDGAEGELEQVLYADLEAVGQDIYDTWSVAEGRGTVVDPFAAENPTIFWITGEEAESTLTASDRAALEPLLDAGTNLILSGQNLTEDIGGTDFFRDYLHASPLDPNTGEGVVVGVEGHPVTGGLAERPMVMVQRSPSSMTPAADATAGLVYYGSGKTAAVTYDGNPEGEGHKVAVIGFDIGLIQNQTERRDLVRSLVEWRSVVGIDEQKTPPSVPGAALAVLRPNAPNPFNPVTTITFDLAAATHAILSVHAADGRLLRTLVNESLAAGTHSYRWDGRDDRGDPVPSGVYLYRLRVGDTAITRRMVLLK